MEKLKSLFKRDGCKEILKAKEFSLKNANMKGEPIDYAYAFFMENNPKIIKKYEKLIKNKDLSPDDTNQLFKDFIADWIKTQLENCKEIKLEDIFKKGGKPKKKTTKIKRKIKPKKK